MAEPRRYHLMGIGGTGMSALAELLARSGARVSGCDLRPSAAVQEYLAGLGVEVHVGHDPRHLDGEVDELVVSSAIPPNHPERHRAAQRGIPVTHRAEALARLAQGRRMVAVAGAHGKTTVTALCAHVFDRLGLDPLAAVGFALAGKPTGARWGSGPWAVVEADESDGSFLHFRPDLAVVTNIEPDHLENYRGSFDQLVAAYQRFLDYAAPDGAWVLGTDNGVLRELLEQHPAAVGRRRVVTYALEAPAEWTARGIRLEGRGSRFEALWRGQSIGTVTLAIPGRHNVANALAVLAACQLAGLQPEKAAAAMQDFAGARRRFEVVAEVRGVTVVDDYAHHPTEIEATLRAAVEGFGRPVLAIFQPHRYHRTAQLLHELAAAFGRADRLILTEVYAPPPEEPLPEVSGARLAGAVRLRPEWRGREDRVAFCATLDEAFEQALRWIQGDTLVLVMGAGDITRLAHRLAAALRPSAGPSGAY